MHFIATVIWRQNFYRSGSGRSIASVLGIYLCAAGYIGTTKQCQSDPESKELFMLLLNIFYCRVDGCYLGAENGHTHVARHHSPMPADGFYDLAMSICIYWYFQTSLLMTGILTHLKETHLVTGSYHLAIFSLGSNPAIFIRIQFALHSGVRRPDVRPLFKSSNTFRDLVILALTQP